MTIIFQKSTLLAPFSQWKQFCSCSIIYKTLACYFALSGKLVLQHTTGHCYAFDNLI